MSLFSKENGEVFMGPLNLNSSGPRHLFCTRCHFTAEAGHCDGTLCDRHHSIRKRDYFLDSQDHS